jgi:hypothetical protein
VLDNLNHRVKQGNKENLKPKAPYLACQMFLRPGGGMHPP